jgi:hypothetical protein
MSYEYACVEWRQRLVMHTKSLQLFLYWCKLQKHPHQLQATPRSSCAPLYLPVSIISTYPLLEKKNHWEMSHHANGTLFQQLYDFSHAQRLSVQSFLRTPCGPLVLLSRRRNASRCNSFSPSPTHLRSIKKWNPPLLVCNVLVFCRRKPWTWCVTGSILWRRPPFSFYYFFFCDDFFLACRVWRGRMVVCVSRSVGVSKLVETGGYLFNPRRARFHRIIFLCRWGNRTNDFLESIASKPSPKSLNGFCQTSCSNSGDLKLTYLVHGW